MTFPRSSQTGKKAGRLESWLLSPCRINAKVELVICQFLMAEIDDRNSAPSIPGVGEQQAKTTNQAVIQMQDPSRPIFQGKSQCRLGAGD